MRNEQIEENPLMAILGQIRISSILPFTEYPSDRHSLNEEKKDGLEASDLFSFFTANIIKEEVIFTR